jgi:hypothetical protein
LHCAYAEGGSRGDVYLLWASNLQPFWSAHHFLHFFRMLADSAYCSKEDKVSQLFHKCIVCSTLPSLQ